MLDSFKPERQKRNEKKIQNNRNDRNDRNDRKQINICINNINVTDFVLMTHKQNKSNH